MESVIFRDVVSDRLSMLQRMTLHLIRIGTTDWTQWVIKKKGMKLGGGCVN